MKLSIALYVFLLSLSLQANSISFDEFIEAHYEGGTKGFLTLFYENVNYPNEARSHCVMGVVKIRLTISETGKVEKIGFYNKLGYGIEEEIVRVIELTEGNWKDINAGNSNVDILIEWRINEEPEELGDIRIVTEVQGMTCMSTTLLEKRMRKYIKKEKYNKAREVYDFLMYRNPHSLKYINEGKTILENLN